MRNFRFLGLVLILSLTLTGNVHAACDQTNSDGKYIDESGNYCGTCGTNCNWVLENDTIKITGGTNGEVGRMQDYHPSWTSATGSVTDSPWYEYKSQIKSVDIQGVTNVGAGAFYGFPIKNLSFGNTIDTISWDAFEGHQVQYLELPDSIKYVGTQALDSGLKELIIPDTITTIASSSLVKTNYANLNIICKGSNCDHLKTMLSNYKYEVGGVYYTIDLSDHVSLAGESQCNSTSYYWTGDFCNNRPTDGSDVECAEGYYTNYGDLCEKIKLRYTMPEADAATSDDNENMIEWIFM